MNHTLSDKQFLRKASSPHVSVVGFLEAYSEHIAENYPGATHAMELFKNGEMLPNPALEFVKQVVGQHILKCMVNRAEESIQKQSKKKVSRSGMTGHGKYSVQFFCKLVKERTGETQEILWVDEKGNDTFRVENFQNAERLVDRTQAEITNGLYATISQEISEGKFLTTKVYRNDSIARIFRAKRGPVCKSKPTSAPLKQKMSVHNYVATFSRG